MNAGDGVANGDDLERRLVDLQTRVAYQEVTLEKLDAVVADQESRIAALRVAVERLASRVDATVTAEPSSEGEFETPPHY
jgi:SlyX protein